MKQTTILAHLRDGQDVKVKAYRVTFPDLAPGYDFAVHRMVDRQSWVVSEITTGFNCGRYGATREDAIARTRAVLERQGLAGLRRAMKRAKQTILKANAMKNPFGKTRKQDNPYVTLTAGSWEWRILKLWQSPEKSLTNPYARAFCAVRSPHTFGGFDMGDTYLREIPGAREWLQDEIRKGTSA